LAYPRPAPEPTLAEPAHVIGDRPISLLVRHDFDARIFAKNHRALLDRTARAILHGDGCARVTLREHRLDVALRRDRATVEGRDDVAPIEPRAVERLPDERPGGEHRASRIEQERNVSQPRTPGADLRQEEPRFGEQPAEVGGRARGDVALVELLR